MAPRKAKAEPETTDEEAAESTEEEEAEDEDDEEEAPVSKSVTVTWNGGSREYSKEIHGADFEKLAKQFADQYPEAVLA